MITIRSWVFFIVTTSIPIRNACKREETLKDYAATIDLKMIYQNGYEIEAFLRNVAFREADRCTYCYHDRLSTTANYAKKGKFDAFTSTLL